MEGWTGAGEGEGHACDTSHPTHLVERDGAFHAVKQGPDGVASGELLAVPLALPTAREAMPIVPMVPAADSVDSAALLVVWGMSDF